MGFFQTHQTQESRKLLQSEQPSKKVSERGTQIKAVTELKVADPVGGVSTVFNLLFLTHYCILAFVSFLSHVYSIFNTSRFCFCNIQNTESKKRKLEAEKTRSKYFR